MDAKARIRTAALQLFAVAGYEATSVAEVCRRAKVSNGSFFHAYAAKEALGADLYIHALEDYHRAFLRPLGRKTTARAGISGMLNAHLDWVVESQSLSRLLFEQARLEWHAHMREPQARENEAFATAISEWRAPLVRSGRLIDMPQPMFTAQLIGPAQIFCRAWLSGRSATDPRAHAADLIAGAKRALLA